MSRSFYHYLMTLKGPNHQDAEQVFALSASEDIAFPKQSESYEEVANYLELSVDYLPSMDIFDRLWEQYLDNNQ
ncbi:MAG: YozE family protein [Enterococcus sp.]